MKSTNPWVWALVAALTLFLAGCGGGSSNTGTGDMPGQEMTPADKAKAEYDKANAAEMAAMEATKKAKAQLDMAKLANAYDIYTTGGESGVVATNAKVITDAKAAVEQALADAKAEKMKAEEAKKALDAVSSATPGLAAQKEVAAKAVEKVDEQIKLIEGYLRTVTGYAAKVDTEAEIKALAGETPKDAAESGNNARRVLYMLQPDSAEGQAGNAQSEFRILQRPHMANMIPTKRVAPDTTDDTASTDTGRSKAVIEYDRRGLPEDAMTWEQIAGAGNLIKKAFGTDNMDVDVLPLAGMPIGALTEANGTALTALPAIPATGLADQYYKGIKGTLYCQGSCTVDGGNLMGMLYFQKAGEEVADSTLYYQMKAGNSYYTPYGAYARYGYWLSEAGATTRINIFSHSPAGSAGDVSETAGLAKTATYKGKALGLSVVKTYTAGTPTGQKSGQFTADVTLNAKFGASGTPALGGKIDNFKGNAVGSDWSVTLTEKQDDDLDFDDGVAQGSASAGGPTPSASVWQAKPYGDSATKRPVGVIGNFNAHFGTGHAAGAFATRMDTE